MERYVMVKMEELEELCGQFKKEYGVDLSDKKYSDIQDLKTRWNAVIQDTFGKIEKKTWKKVLWEILYYRDCVYGPPLMEAGKEDCVKERELARKQNQMKLLSLCEESKTLISRYLLYESDVWINAFFSIRYGDLHKKNKGLQKGKNNFYNKNQADMEGFCFPFTYYEEDEFCKECRRILYNRYNQNIFGTQFNMECILGDKEEENKKITRKKGIAEIFLNYSYSLNKIKVYYPYDLNFTRWSYNRMAVLEKQVREKKLEDRILFYFVLNTMYVRNVLGFLEENKSIKKLDEYRELLYKSNRLKSFGWQNFICILFMGIYGEYYQAFNENDADILNGWLEVFNKWWNNYEMINKTLKLLTGALIYIRKPGDDAIIEEMCKFHLDEIEFDNTGLENQIKYEMKSRQLQEKNVCKEIKLRTSNINQGYMWDYAFLQMETIHAKTYYNVQRKDDNK